MATNPVKCTRFRWAFMSQTPVVMVRLTCQEPLKGNFLGPSGHDPEPSRNQPGTNPEPTWNQPGEAGLVPSWFRVGSGWFRVASGLVPGWFRVMAGGPEIVALKWPLACKPDHQ